MIRFMPANHSKTNPVNTILIHSDKTHFQHVFVMLLSCVAQDVTCRCFHSINAMILMLQIFKVIAIENRPTPVNTRIGKFCLFLLFSV